jgi:hypothetical protein
VDQEHAHRNVQLVRELFGLDDGVRAPEESGRDEPAHRPAPSKVSPLRRRA